MENWLEWSGLGKEGKLLGSLNTLTINLCLLGHGSALETAAQTLSCVFSGAEIMKRPQKEGHISASSLNTPPAGYFLLQSPGLGCTPLCSFPPSLLLLLICLLSVSFV